jgi:hypothetical protein
MTNAKEMIEVMTKITDAIKTSSLSVAEAAGMLETIKIDLIINTGSVNVVEKIFKEMFK